jgi:uncharacterized protein (DUF697 family)
MNRRHPALQLFWDTVRRARASVTGDRSRRTTMVASPLSGHDVATALKQLDAIRTQCRAMVTRRASLSAGVAIVPIPGLDIGTDVAILLQLLPRINEKFGLTPTQIEQLDVETKRVVMMFISAVGSNLIGRLITRELVAKLLMKMGVRLTTQGVVKYVPLLGQALSASLSFGAMRLLGNRHIDDCYEVARRALLEAVAPADARPSSRPMLPTLR